MAAHTVKPGSLLAPQYVNGVYIPSGLLIVGIAIIKKEWLPYAVVLAVLWVRMVFSLSSKSWNLAGSRTLRASVCGTWC